MTIRTDVTITKTAEGAFLLDRSSGGCFSLNSEGVHVFQLIAEGKSIPEIVGFMSSAHANVPSDRLKRDVESFIVNLRERELLGS